MTGSRLLAAALLFASLSPVALAVDLTLLAGYQYNADFEFSDEVEDLPDGSAGTEAGDDLGLDGGGALGLALDFEFMGNENQRIGLFLSHHQASFERASGLEDRDMDITHLHFTGMSYYPRGNWEHFVMAGLGATLFDPADSTLKDTTRFSAQIAGGTNYRLTDNLLLRLEARWLPAFFNGQLGRNLLGWMHHCGEIRNLQPVPGQCRPDVQVLTTRAGRDT